MRVANCSYADCGWRQGSRITNDKDSKNLRSVRLRALVDQATYRKACSVRGSEDHLGVSASTYDPNPVVFAHMTTRFFCGHRSGVVMA